MYSTGPGRVRRRERIRDLDHARNVLKRYSEYYDTKTIKMYVAGNRQQRQWIILAARELKLMPTTEGSLAFKLDVTEVIDGYRGQEHTLPLTPMFDDVIKAGDRVRHRAHTRRLLVSYGAPWAENWYYTHENVHDDAKLRRFTPRVRARQQDPPPRRRAREVRPGPGGWFHESGIRLPEARGSPATSLPRRARRASAATASSRDSATTGSCGSCRRAG